MTERLIQLCWLALALLHGPPAGVLVAPGLAGRLYGVDPQGDVGMLVTHRGALFLCVAIACVVAAVDPPSRRLASVVAAVSMIGFLFVFVRAGAPASPLRAIARADMIGLAPLAFAGWAAWR